MLSYLMEFFHELEMNQVMLLDPREHSIELDLKEITLSKIPMQIIINLLLKVKRPKVYQIYL